MTPPRMTEAQAKSFGALKRRGKLVRSTEVDEGVLIVYTTKDIYDIDADGSVNRRGRLGAGSQPG